MKIKSIESIKNFGIFTDYQRNSVKDFGNNNIIFGWNYSGKTTLSRIFRSLEKKVQHPDYTGGKFKIITDDSSEINETDISTNPLKLRVFNSDYIRENLSWEQTSTGIPPILIIGEENIKLQEQVTLLNQEKDELLKKFSEATNRKRTLESELSSLLTNEARRITNELSLGRNFDRTSLRTLVEDSNVDTWELTEENFQ